MKRVPHSQRTVTHPEPCSACGHSMSWHYQNTGCLIFQRVVATGEWWICQCAGPDLEEGKSDD